MDAKSNHTLLSIIPFELFSHGNKNIYWFEDSGVSLTTEGTSQYQILD